jgi:hypothetical protein
MRGWGGRIRTSAWRNGNPHRASRSIALQCTLRQVHLPEFTLSAKSQLFSAGPECLFATRSASQPKSDILSHTANKAERLVCAARMQFRTFASEAFDPKKKYPLPVRRRPGPARGEDSSGEGGAYGQARVYSAHGCLLAAASAASFPFLLRLGIGRAASILASGSRSAAASGRVR